MFRETIPDDRSRDVEAPFAEFRGCRQHDQVTASCRVETGTTAEIRRRYADVLETRTGTSDTAEWNALDRRQSLSFWEKLARVRRRRSIPGIKSTPGRSNRLRLESGRRTANWCRTAPPQVCTWPSPVNTNSNNEHQQVDRVNFTQGRVAAARESFGRVRQCWRVCPSPSNSGTTRVLPANSNSIGSALFVRLTGVVNTWDDHENGISNGNRIGNPMGIVRKWELTAEEIECNNPSPVISILNTHRHTDHWTCDVCSNKPHHLCHVCDAFQWGCYAVILDRHVLLIFFTFSEEKTPIVSCRPLWRFTNAQVSACTKWTLS